LRWDHYELDPSPDAIWLDDFPDLEVVSVEDSQITPRLAALYKTENGWSLYGQYSRGFRAPPFEDANIGLVIPLFGYRAIPNPDLRSETSDGFEAGARRLVADTYFSFAVFHTRYDDFIESRALIGTDPQTGELLFQSRNIDRARIRGVDVRLEQDLGAWSETLDGLLLKLAGYWSEGENRENGQPLNSIAPPQVVAGAAWTSPSAAFQVELMSTITAAKDSDDIDQTAGARYSTPGWAVLDLTASWRISDRLEVTAGVFNLGDSTYWRWLDVARLVPTDPMIPILSLPGRSYALTTRLRF
jgi:hemoglobin/transferrin/lactoferrin receptor protein